MFTLSIRCPTCQSELPTWNDTQESIYCALCHSTYFSNNGIFHIYPEANRNENIDIKERVSSFSYNYIGDANLQGLKRIIPTLFQEQLSSKIQNKVFLDAGCGYGDLSIAASEYFDDVVAVDAGNQELEFLASRIQQMGINNVHLFKTSLEKLPFTKEQFAAIGCIQVLEHVHDQQRVIEKFFTCLSPNGLLYLSTPNRYSIKPEVHTKIWGVSYLPKKLGGAYAKLYGKDKEYQGINLLSINEIKKMLSAQFGRNITLIRSGFHQSFLGRLAKFAWDKPVIKTLAQALISDIEVVALKKSAASEKSGE